MEFIFPFSGSITFSPFNHTLRWHKQTYIGLKIELPVFEGWQKDRRSATLKIMEEKLEKQKEQLHTEIDQKAKILINKMDIAQRNAGIKKNEMNLSRLLFNKIIRNYSKDSFP